jgi:cytoskeleton protein RodZ
VSFGKELQHERTARGVSLESIAAGTRVSERYLTALENGDHAKLPGGIFNKGIVRAYCRHLGLDEEDWLQRFATFSRAEGEEDWEQFARNVKRNRIPPGPSTGLRWLGVLLMLAILAALAWAAWRYLIKPRYAPVQPPHSVAATPWPSVQSPPQKNLSALVAKSA